ncbi:hypothetical protein M949_1737 [Riemerella anatipestifer CH3]|nr:hypothetical protein M949_1737 [Riemerella anatipestifer CH3]
MRELNTTCEKVKIRQIVLNHNRGKVKTTLRELNTTCEKAKTR